MLREYAPFEPSRISGLLATCGWSRRRPPASAFIGNAGKLVMPVTAGPLLGIGRVIALCVPPEDAVQGVLGGVVEVLEIHLLGFLGGPEAAAGESLQRRVHLVNRDLGR